MCGLLPEWPLLSSPPLPLSADQASLVVQVQPPRSIVPQGGPHSLRCQVSGSPPHYFYWSREDGRPLPSSTQQRHQGTYGPNPMNHPVGREALGLSLPCGDPALTQGWVMGGGYICINKFLSVPHQAPSSTSPASSPLILGSTFAPVVIIIMPTPAAENCWSLVSSSFSLPRTACPGLG